MTVDQDALRRLIDDLTAAELGSYEEIRAGALPSYRAIARMLGEITPSAEELALIHGTVGNVVYRGYLGTESAEGWRSIHWTRSLDMARFFAGRFLGTPRASGLRPYVASYKVRSVHDLILVLSDEDRYRTEHEVLLRVDRIRSDNVQIEMLG